MSKNFKKNQKKREAKEANELKEKLKAEDKRAKDENIDYEDYFKDFNTDEFDITDEQLKKDIEKYAPKPNVRTYSELKAEAKKKLGLALTGIVFATTTEYDDFTLNDEVDLERIRYKVDRDLLKTTLFEFAFIFGNYNKNRKWILIGEGVYFCLPDLLTQGNHTVLVTLFAEKISMKLKNSSNAVTVVLEKKNFEIKSEMRQYCFSKGHLVCANEQRINILSDLRIIFTEMRKQAQDRNFDNIKTLAKKRS